MIPKREREREKNTFEIFKRTKEFDIWHFDIHLVNFDIILINDSKPLLLWNASNKT